MIGRLVSALRLEVSFSARFASILVSLVAKPTLSPHLSLYLFPKQVYLFWLLQEKAWLDGWFCQVSSYFFWFASQVCAGCFGPIILPRAWLFLLTPAYRIPVLAARCLGQISLSCLLFPTQLCEMPSFCHAGLGASQFFMLGLPCFWHICVLATSCAWCDFKLFVVYLCWRIFKYGGFDLLICDPKWLLRSIGPRLVYHFCRWHLSDLWCCWSIYTTGGARSSGMKLSRV